MLQFTPYIPLVLLAAGFWLFMAVNITTTNSIFTLMFFRVFPILVACACFFSAALLVVGA